MLCFTYKVDGGRTPKPIILQYVRNECLVSTSSGLKRNNNHIILLCDSIDVEFEANRKSNSFIRKLNVDNK